MLLGLLGLGEACPVDSMTTCTPTDSQSSLAGILFGEHLMFLPSTVMESSDGGDLVGQVAQNGVVLQKMGQRLGAGQVVDGYECPVPWSLSAVRRILRPMRPKPLMPTLIAMSPRSFCEIKTRTRCPRGSVYSRIQESLTKQKA